MDRLIFIFLIGAGLLLGSRLLAQNGTGNNAGAISTDPTEAQPGSAPLVPPVSYPATPGIAGGSGGEQRQPRQIAVPSFEQPVESSGGWGSRIRNPGVITTPMIN